MELHKKRAMYGTNKRETIYKKVVRLITVKLVFYVLVALAILSFILLPHIVRYHKRMQPSKYNYIRYGPDLKYVLIWKERRQEKALAAGQKLFVEQRCSHINCYFTYDKSLLDNNVTNFDAVIFNVQDIRKAQASKLDMMRSPHQKYIFRSLQPSAKYPICSDRFEGFFNLTWTYKLDSDIPQPFFNVYNALNKMVGPKTYVDWLKTMKHNTRIFNKIQNKTKAVSWIINKCSTKSKQSHFVKDLTKELRGYNYTVDVYGACAPNKCPEEKLWKCYKMIENDYYFNLVLEDYMSADYLTENIVKTMTHHTLPIVSGGVNFDRFLPPGSYINVQDHSLKSLAAIIDYLIKNPVKYSYFYDWKNYYYVTEKPVHHVCDLCAKLNEDLPPKPAYKNFRWWWNPEFDSTCKPWFSNGTEDNNLV